MKKEKDKNEKKKCGGFGRADLRDRKGKVDMAQMCGCFAVEVKNLR
jgi:hypothetical protein